MRKNNLLKETGKQSKHEGGFGFMRKNSKRIVTGIVMGAMLAGLTACSAEAKLEKQLELGNSSLNAGNYEEAITAFETALTLDTSSLEAYAGLVAAMNLNGADSVDIKELVEEFSDVVGKKNASETGMTDEEIALAESFYLEAANAVSKDPEAELEVLENGIEVLSEATSITESYTETAEEVIEQYLAGNNWEEAKNYAEKLSEVVPDDTQTHEYVTSVTEQIEEEQALAELMEQAVTYISNGDWQALADYTESEELAVIREKIGDAGSYVYLFEGGNTGLGIGYYSFEGCECDQWYYGEYTDGVRSGEGGWYWAANYSQGLYLETYEGQWSEDAPNGDGYKYYEYAGVVEQGDIIVVNGLTHGTYTHDFNINGDIYTETYEAENGRYVEVPVEDWIADDIPEGMYCYCIVYVEKPDGGTTASWLHTYEDSVYGISHFR